MSNLKNFSSKRASKRSAFTLIELSIVLIIIGLLVAGVTGGSSLIRSAQLRSVMSEARGWNVAVNAFVAQYDSMPGDYSVTLTNTDTDLNGVASNFDSYIDFIAANEVYEGFNAWYHLINSGTLDEELTQIVDTQDVDVTGATTALNAQTITPGTQIPRSKLDGVGWMFAKSSNQNESATVTEFKNVVIATGSFSTGTNTAATVNYLTPTGAMTPSDALSIDTKLDDGDPTDGNVTASDLLGGDGTIAALQDTSANDPAAQSDCYDESISVNAYNTANDTSACALEFTVDIS